MWFSTQTYLQSSLSRGMWTNLIGAIKKALVHLAEPTLSQETVYFEAMCRCTDLIIGETPETNVPLWTLICDEVIMRGLHHDHWFCHLCTNKTKIDEASDTQIMQMLPTIRGDHANSNQLYQSLEKSPHILQKVLEITKLIRKKRICIFWFYDYLTF